MLRKFFAGILLIPASFVVYGSLGAWFRALLQGKRSFFSYVVKKGPSVVPRPDSRVLRMVAYYPMKAGIEVLHTGNLSPILGKAVKIILRHSSTTPDIKRQSLEIWTDKRPPFVSPERILHLIRDPAIKVISFDIFDTLLVRPVLEPKDIFYLLDKKIHAVYNIDFIKIRWKAEEELGLGNATLRQIYDGIAQRYKLDATTAQALLEEEIHCEKSLLSPRPDAELLYKEAVRLGKRIIAVSDMYLPGDVLADILQAKGCPVDAVYVSCDHAARKSDGVLYDKVLEQEGIAPSALLHIGDNYQSDYVQAIHKHICAVWLPAITKLAFSNADVGEIICGKAMRRDPLWGVFLGHGLNRLYGHMATAPDHIGEIRTMRHFAELVLAPIVTALGFFLATNKEIQQNYKTLYFASRDGWLPHQVYDIVCRHLGKGIPGTYFYAGRRAYFTFLHDDFLKYATSLEPTHDDIDAYTLSDFIQAWFKGENLLTKIFETITQNEADLPFLTHKEECLDILRRFSDDIDNCMREKKHRARTYYATIFDPTEKRHLVFDLGYSGSVGKALTAATGKPVDKVYFWQEPANKLIDKELGSKTLLILKPGIGPQFYDPYHLALEELFSPCEGSVIDFDTDANPVKETLKDIDILKNELNTLHTACLEYAKSFCILLNEYAQYAGLCEVEAGMDVFRALLNDTFYNNMDLFRNIVFPDPVYRKNINSLAKKIEYSLKFPTVFSQTGFDNQRNIIVQHSQLYGKLKVGIHLHLYFTEMAYEVIRYLQDFPIPFDLFVTICDDLFAPTAQQLFCAATLPQVQQVRVLTVPNRGRDVAPWVLGMRPYQAKYDLFCHIHSKESEHIGFGAAWRTYLYDNLILADSAREIIHLFEQDAKLGCLFPEIHPQLRMGMTHTNVPLYGSNKEYTMICDMQRRMGLGEELRREDIFFSGGTMFWYRPQALRQLFTCDLQLEEFAPEPIGIGGTLAHAMERLPALVATRNGYTARTFTPHAAHAL